MISTVLYKQMIEGTLHEIILYLTGSVKSLCIISAIFHMKIQIFFAKIIYNFPPKSGFPDHRKNQIPDPEFF